MFPLISYLTDILVYLYYILYVCISAISIYKKNFIKLSTDEMDYTNNRIQL